MTDKTQHLTGLIAQLERLITQIVASGPVAETAARLYVSTHSKSGYEYARLRNSRAVSSCGRVGSEPYLEALATLQRRDKIAHVTQAIIHLQQADEISVALSRVDEVFANEREPIPIPTPKTKAVPTIHKKAAPKRKLLYTHVKTKQGSVVHAVLGKDKSGAWHKAALCGAVPPKRDPMGWEFPDRDDGITCLSATVSCLQPVSATSPSLTEYCRLLGSATLSMF